MRTSCICTGKVVCMHTFLGLGFVIFAKWPLTPKEWKATKEANAPVCVWLKCSQPCQTSRWESCSKSPDLPLEGVPWLTPRPPSSCPLLPPCLPSRGCGTSFLHGPHQHTNLFLPFSRVYTGFFYYDKFHRQMKENKYITNDIKLARFSKPHKFHSEHQRIYLEPK